ncbi:MAG: LysR substrate-binding domain-containing protein [Nevskia sp.]|nr:LysR substrate-binding domain-containing protein [Nevskia sp.]
MDLDELRIFRAVVDAGGITAAARQLHRVQSNVTTRVRQLEETLGVELFKREGRRLSLSSAGRRLYDYADRLLALAEEARAAVVEEPAAQRLRLGSMESVAASRLPAVLAGFFRRHPQVQVDLTTGQSRRLVTAVAEGQLDAAVVGEPVDPQVFSELPLWTEELVLVADAGQARVPSAREVRGRALLVFSSGCAYRARLEQWLTAARIVPERTVELGSYHAILACAAAGAGVAAVPRSVIDGYAGRAALSLHRLPERYARVPIRLVSPRHKPQAARDLFAAHLQAGLAPQRRKATSAKAGARAALATA